jgi:hypothetical protein
MTDSGVKIVQTATGNLILGTITELGDKIIITKPMEVVVNAAPDGISVGLQPFCPFIKGDKVELNKSLVLFAEVAEHGLESAYRQHTSSIIQAPSAALSQLTN